ncbi:MAG: thiamine-phosphate kinase [Chromatiales bacterium]|jgi:thiamine-monophosphate kinase
MTEGEFALIDQYFASPAVTRADVSLGSGDDCALLDIPPGKQLAVTMDTLVAGRHFLPDTDPWRLGWKVLAVNLSDLAAMGAEPAWVTLAVTLPAIDDSWLAAFMQGFSALARQQSVQLVGGDTTRGPMAFTLQAHGLLEAGRALLRSGARPGDTLYVTGNLGGAGAALKSLLDGDLQIPDVLRRSLEQPEPRVTPGRLLAGIASSCIDLSDGLAGDLGHILDASGCGATVELERLPLLPETRVFMQRYDDWQLPLIAGDDYELLFSVPQSREQALRAVEPKLGCRVTRIGRIEAEPGLRFVDAAGKRRTPCHAWDHFRDDD